MEVKLHQMSKVFSAAKALGIKIKTKSLIKKDQPIKSLNQSTVVIDFLDNSMEDIKKFKERIN